MDIPTKEKISDALEALMTDLGQVYENKGKKLDFEAEKPVLMDLLRALIPQLATANYELVKPLAIGSTAVVWLVRDTSLEVERALKLPRPRYGKVSEIISVIRTERAKLASLNHPNVVRVYFAHHVEVDVGQDSYEFPYFVMEFLHGIQDLDEYILEHRQTLSAENIITYFRDALAGLDYLHGVGIIHCDVKPANLLIATDSPAMISDLGYAKPFRRIPRPDDALTTVTYTPPYAHPLLRRHMIESSDSNANKAEIKPEQLDVAFDLYAFGRTMQVVLKAVRDAEVQDVQLLARSDDRSVLSAYQWQYLELISRRLLDGKVTESLEDDTIPGLAPSIMPEIKYLSAADALEDVEKLLNLYDLEGEVPELNPNCATYVQIPLYKASLTPRVRRLLNHPALNKLRQITQLGFVSLVYPGATHSRFEHVLGTYSACCEYIRALWYDETSSLFRSVMRRSDLELVLVAALLHDVSQYPMAHDLGESHERFDHERYLETTLLSMFPGAEATLAQLVASDWRPPSDSPGETVEPSSENAVEDLLELVSPPRDASLRTRILHSIISGPLDCDKLDYLRRDSVHLGVPYGASMDHQRLLRNLTVVYTSRNVNEQDEHGRSVAVSRLDRAEVGVSEKALAASQAVWKTRQDMFRQVYWQHTVRAFKSMLAFVVRRVLRTSADANAETFWLDFDRWLFDWHVLGELPIVPGEPPASTDPNADAVAGDPASQAPVSALAPTDDSLIEFFHRRSDEIGRKVLDGIRQRRPYRRVAVMSKPISGDRYDHLYHQFRALRQREDLHAIEQLRATWQNALVDELERQLSTRQVTVLPGGMSPVDAIQLMRDEEALILIDIPIKVSGTGGQDSLLYVPEDVAGVHARTHPFPEVRESKVSLTQEPFDQEVGKIRIFVEPTWSGIVARYLSDNQILEAIINA